MLLLRKTKKFPLKSNAKRADVSGVNKRSNCVSLLVWTVRTKEDLLYAIDNGVNNVIFEKIIPEENGLEPGKLKPAK